MKRSNVWRDQSGNIWEVRDGGVWSAAPPGYGFGGAIKVYADDRMSQDGILLHWHSQHPAREAWEVLIGEPLPVPVAEPSLPETWTDPNGWVWHRHERGIGREPLVPGVWLRVRPWGVTRVRSDGTADPLGADEIDLAERASVAWSALMVPPVEPKKRPRKFRDSDGGVWIRGFRRGEVLTWQNDDVIVGAQLLDGDLRFTDDEGLVELLHLLYH